MTKAITRASTATGFAGLMVGLALIAAGPAQASFPGTNGVIVFERGGDLYSTDPGASEATRLTKTKLFEANPSISPDGRTVAFERGKKSNDDVVPRVSSRVWSMRIDGSHQRRLTGLKGAANVKENRYFGTASPSFSPDGETIVFQQTEFYAMRFDNIPDAYIVRHNKIYTMRADGSSKKLLSEGADDTRPLFAPGGEIVFFGNKRRNDVYSMSANGKNRQLFPELSFRDSDLGFAPDGGAVVFAGDSRDPGECSEVYSVNADGTGLLRLTANDLCDDSPVVSPDGQQLAYVQYPAEQRHRCEQGTIMLAALDGTNPQPLTSGCTLDWAPN